MGVDRWRPGNLADSFGSIHIVGVQYKTLIQTQLLRLIWYCIVMPRSLVFHGIVQSFKKHQQTMLCFDTNFQVGSRR